jgi:hypothetical protein
MAKIHSSPFFRGILQNRIFLKRAWQGFIKIVILK